jgi:hypothetical protein
MRDESGEGPMAGGERAIEIRGLRFSYRGGDGGLAVDGIDLDEGARLLHRSRASYSS